MNIFLPQKSWAVFLSNPEDNRNGQPDIPSWDIRKTEPSSWPCSQNGYLLPSDPNYGVPKYTKFLETIQFDGTLYSFGRPTENSTGQKFTPQQMADCLIQNTHVLLENLKQQQKIRIELLKKMYLGQSISTHSSEQLEDVATDPENRDCRDIVLGARDELNSYLSGYFKSFYTSLQQTSIEIHKFIQENPQITPSMWQPFLEQIKRDHKPVAMFRPNYGELSLDEKIQRMALAQYWLKDVENILKKLDDFLDTHDLRGTRHDIDYTPPKLDLTRNYWKNTQGQWCSGYGVILDKLDPNHSDAADKKTYPLLRKEPITDSTDYCTNNEEISKFQSFGGWFMLLQEKDKKKEDVVGQHKNINDLDMEASNDLMAQLNIMIPEYLRAEKSYEVHTHFINKDGLERSVDEFSSENRLYGAPLAGHRDLLTRFIIGVVGPFYDNIKESLTLAEKTIAELENQVSQAIWHPIFKSFVEKNETPNVQLIHNYTNPKEKVAAAYYILKKLLPLEKKWDAFFDQHIFLRGVVYLFPGYDDYVDYAAYRWTNAYGYQCRGFGRLLSPRKLRLPMNLDAYNLQKNKI